jgi:RNA polymerase sigma factor (sigma-70 family)
MNPPQVFINHLKKEDLMHSNAKTRLIANLFSEFRTSGNTSRTFSKLLSQFDTEIAGIASTFPFFWVNDFIQEGTVGLYNAAVKYPVEASQSQFYFYALSAIRRKMLDFYQSVIGRTMIEEVSFEIDGQSTTSKQSIFQQVEKYSEEYNEAYNSLYGVASTVDYVESTSLAIDFKYQLSKESMKKNNFTNKEINVFDLHFNKGFNVSETATQIKLSVSQTSKIINKTKIKMQKLLAYPLINTSKQIKI